MEEQLFTGKSAKYNILILKILYQKGTLTPWDLSKEIANLTREKSENIYHKTQKIQSVLIRKDGRLINLVNRQFLKKTPEGYCLTFSKGVCTALTLFDEEELLKPAINIIPKFENINSGLSIIAHILSNFDPVQFKMSYKHIRILASHIMNKEPLESEILKTEMMIKENHDLETISEDFRKADIMTNYYSSNPEPLARHHFSERDTNNLLFRAQMFMFLLGTLSPDSPTALVIYDYCLAVAYEEEIIDFIKTLDYQEGWKKNPIIKEWTPELQQSIYTIISRKRETMLHEVKLLDGALKKHDMLTKDIFPLQT
jgi:hypothetical protein